MSLAHILIIGANFGHCGNGLITDAEHRVFREFFVLTPLQFLQDLKELVALGYADRHKDPVFEGEMEIICAQFGITEKEIYYVSDRTAA